MRHGYYYKIYFDKTGIAQNMLSCTSVYTYTYEAAD